jgi:twinkle protein
MDKPPDKFLGHVNCDSCGGSDCNAEYETQYHCFTCGNHIWKDDHFMQNVIKMDSKPVNKTLPDIEHTKVGPLPDRNITKDTCRSYDVRVTVKDGVITEHWYPYTNSDGELVAYKKRIVATKDFPQFGNTKKGVLFGQSKFTAKGKYITICEGEVDTLAVFQMNGSKFPVVGVKSSSEAYKNCKDQFEYLDSFDNIIICMDNDDPGKKAANAIASLFPKKAKIVKLKLNDAGKYLEQNKEAEFTHAWWQAEQYKPDDILNGFDTMWEIAQQPRAEAMFMYPWAALNKVTYGIRTSEFMVITAGSGMGKTQVLREITHHALKASDKNIGVIYLEETAWETAHGLASIEGNKPFHLPDAHFTEDEKKDAFMQTWGTDRIHTLNDSWRDNGIDYLGDKIKFLARGLDCKLLVLDHLSFMVSDQSGDERKMLDEIAHKLKALTVELDIALLSVCHSRRQSGKPHEEGAATSLSDLRGTAGIGQLSNIVLGLERNGQADDPIERNTTLIRVLKNRFSGKTGPTSRLYYDEFTGRLSELGDEGEK